MLNIIHYMLTAMRPAFKDAAYAEEAVLLLEENMKRFLGVVVSIALSAPLAIASTAAWADTLDNIKAAGKIRIAMDLGIPPWAYKDENLKNTGPEVANVELLAKDLGVELEIVPTTGANRIPFLLSNKADLVLSTLSITPEREKIVLFSIPYSGATEVVAAPQSMEIKGFEDLVGKSIAVTRGTMLDTQVTKGALPGTDIVRFEDESTTITSVVTNQVNIIAQTTALIPVINEKNPAADLEPKFLLHETLYGVAMRKGDDALKAWVDDWIRKNVANGKLNENYKKFLKTDMPASIAETAK
ncbi:transporter substrate-binding domain-containing protein [Rhizobium binxianense]